jgi:hypothetical protein
VSRYRLFLALGILMGVVSVMVACGNFGPPQARHPRVPKYEVNVVADESCPESVGAGAADCYWVDTEARDEESLALIANDLVGEAPLTSVQFTDNGYPFGTGYVMDPGDADEVLGKKIGDATVSDGAYIFVPAWRLPAEECETFCTR